MALPAVEAFVEMYGGGDMIRNLVLLVILVLSALSLYFSRFQGAKIRIIDVQDQTPLSTAHHTVIFTNYGNRMGVALGPELNCTEDADVTETEGRAVIPVQPHGTVISEVDVSSNVNKNFSYNLFYKDRKGKKINLPTYKYYGKARVREEEPVEEESA